MTISWTINYLPYVATQDSLSDVVQSIFWTITNTETVDGETYTVNEIGSNFLNDPDPSSFTAYKSIEEEDAVSWLKAMIGADDVSKLEQIVTDKMTNLKNGKPQPLRFHNDFPQTGLFKVSKNGGDPQDLNMTKPF